MSISILVSNNIAANAGFSWLAGGTPKAVAWQVSFEAAAASAIDVTEIVVTGSSGGSVSYTGGGVKMVKQKTIIGQDIVTLVFWIETADLSGLSGTTLTPSFTFTGTLNGSANYACNAMALDAATPAIVFDTSTVVNTLSAATPWSESTMTCAANSIQIAASGASTSSTRVNSVGASTPSSFAEDRDTTSGSHNIYAGHYLNNAGGSRGVIVSLTAADTGGLVVVSLKEAPTSAVSPGQGSATLTGTQAGRRVNENIAPHTAAPVFEEVPWELLLPSTRHDRLPQHWR